MFYKYIQCSTDKKRKQQFPKKGFCHGSLHELLSTLKRLTSRQKVSIAKVGYLQLYKIMCSPYGLVPSYLEGDPLRGALHGPLGLSALS